MSAARLKHFGWGREGEGLTAEEEAFVMGRAEARIGTTLKQSASAPRLEDIKLEAPHVMAPASIPFCTSEHYDRVAQSIARGRAWLDEIVSGTASIEAIAARQKCSVRQVNMTISMAFIAPALVKAAVEGRLPRGIGVATLRDAPAEWSLQFERLGLAQP